ncbi:MAG: hypothetical protein RLZZ234_764 [Candidatus Parcubacteria bacterium]|jgi:hypothetical protein
MYILHKEAVRPLRAIATLVVIALVLWSLGIMPFGRNAEAANLTSISDTLSDSDLGVASNHTFAFTMPNGAVTGQTIVLNFPAQFTVAGTGATGLDFNDVDVVVGGNNITLAASPSGTTWGVSTTTSTIVLTTSSSSGATVASSTAVIVRIGTNATVGTAGDTRITNPATAASYELTVNGSIPDSGQTRVAIIDDVVVTANVDTSFTFVISGVASGATVNGSATTTATTTTATSVPFETLSAGTSKTLAQNLAVTTNAIQGFVVTVEQSQNLLSSTGADIDGFSNGAYTNTPTAWTAPSNNLSLENTWGHWGITSEDNLNADEFGTDLWVAASTTPRQVFSHNGPSDGTTANIGSTRIGYQAQITSLQEAADDYNTTLTYIATPTF